MFRFGAKQFLVNVAISLLASSVASLLTLNLPKPIGRLATSVDTVFPIGEPLIRFTAWFLLAFICVTIVVLAIGWSVDRLDEGPSRRTLKSLEGQIGLCISLMLQLDSDTSYPSISSDAQIQANWGRMTAELDSLLRVLHSIGVSRPSVLLDTRENLRILIGYLSSLQPCARRLDLEQAREIGRIYASKHQGVSSGT